MFRFANPFFWNYSSVLSSVFCIFHRRHCRFRVRNFHVVLFLLIFPLVLSLTSGGFLTSMISSMVLAWGGGFPVCTSHPGSPSPPGPSGPPGRGHVLRSASSVWAPLSAWAAAWGPLQQHHCWLPSFGFQMWNPVFYLKAIFPGLRSFSFYSWKIFLASLRLVFQYCLLRWTVFHGVGGDLL